MGEGIGAEHVQTASMKYIQHVHIVLFVVAFLNIQAVYGALDVGGYNHPVYGGALDGGHAHPVSMDYGLFLPLAVVLLLVFCALCLLSNMVTTIGCFLFGYKYGEKVEEQISIVEKREAYSEYP